MKEIGKQTEYDIAIIGAGIQGAGLAQAASAAGFKVIVLEKNVVASATSCKSSKLIHGGLRYLESLQFNLVYECLHERNLLTKLAPNLVKLVPFYIPIYKHSQRKPWQVRLGLFLYWALSGFNKYSGFQTVNPDQWHKLHGLNTNNLLQVFCYQDGQTDDKLLTQAVMQSAIEMGTKLHCHADFVKSEKKTDDIKVFWKENGEEYFVRSKVLVNCTGPWIEKTNQKLDRPLPLPDLDKIKGSHIIIPEELGKQIFYVEAEDGRAVFIMPWRDQNNHPCTLIGTTENTVNNEPDQIENPTASQSEITYLLSTASHHFPQLRNYSPKNIQSSFAGLRVLPGENKKAFHRHRETLSVFDNTNVPRYVATAGGKLTSYRIGAEKLLKQLLPTLGQRQTGKTKEIELERPGQD